MSTRPEVTQAKTKQHQTLYTVRLDSCTLGKKNIKHNQATNEKQVFEKRKTLETIKWLGNSIRSSSISFPQFNAK